MLVAERDLNTLVPVAGVADIPLPDQPVAVLISDGRTVIDTNKLA
jgi:hypothetical protein